MNSLQMAMNQKFFNLIQENFYQEKLFSIVYFSVALRQQLFNGEYNGLTSKKEYGSKSLLLFSMSLCSVVFSLYLWESNLWNHYVTYIKFYNKHELWNKVLKLYIVISYSYIFLIYSELKLKRHLLSTKFFSIILWFSLWFCILCFVCNQVCCLYFFFR